MNEQKEPCEIQQGQMKIPALRKEELITVIQAGD